MNLGKARSKRTIGVSALALAIMLPGVGIAELKLPQMRPHEDVLLAKPVDLSGTPFLVKEASGVFEGEMGFEHSAAGAAGTVAMNDGAPLDILLPGGALKVGPAFKTPDPTQNLSEEKSEVFGAYGRSLDVVEGAFARMSAEAFRIAMEQKAKIEEFAKQEAARVPPPTVNIATSDIVGGGLPETKAQFVRDLEKDPTEAEAVLEYGRYLIGAMMLPEARTMLEGAQRDYLRDPRITALLRAVDLIEKPEVSPRSAAFHWEQDSLWEYLERIKGAGSRPSSDEIKIATRFLLSQSEQVVTEVLPQFFERSVDLKDRELARMLLEIAVQRTELPGTPRFLFMQGQLALIEGDKRNAFDFYASVVEEHGLEGAEAVLALSDLALQRGNRAILNEIQELLIEATEDWRGDDVSLRIMTRLAQVAEEIHDFPVAIEVMENIRRDFPRSREAVLAKRRLSVLIEALSEKITAHDFPLDEAVSTVRRIDPKLERDPDWLLLRLEFASRLSDSSLLEATNAEYAHIEQAFLRIPNGSKELKARIAIEHGEVLLEMDDPEEALTQIARVDPPEGGDYRKRYFLVGMRAGAPELRGNIAALMDEYSDDMDFLREAAQAAIRIEAWEEAAIAYQSLQDLGGELGRVGAAQYAYAASVSGNRDMIKTTDFGVENSDLLPSADGISWKMPVLQPLSESSARRMLGRANEVLISGPGS